LGHFAKSQNYLLNKFLYIEKYICIDMKKYTDNILLTKEAFELYSRQLREETAKQHGMTLEEWDTAVLNQTTVGPIVEKIHNHISGSME